MLPNLNDQFEITDDQVQNFRRNGHTLTPGLLSNDEVAVYRKVISDGVEIYNTEKRPLAERDTYGMAFLQIMNLWEVDESIRQFTLAKRFAHVAAQLLGVDHVRLYHDQALYKEPGGGLTPWHQDQYYWPLSTNNTVTMWMPLIDIDEDMGMLTFASESHKSGFVGNVEISDESEALLDQYVKEKSFAISRPKHMNAGDATWHYGWTLHAAPGNKSDITREVMTIIYYADGASVITPKNENQENDRNRWLQGLEPGSLAASEINPLVL